MEKLSRDVVVEATKQAEKSVKDEKIKWLKELILRTLERIEDVKKTRQEADEQLKILEQDIKDLKLGRIDLIEERQRLNPRAKNASIIKIEKPQPKETNITIINNHTVANPVVITHEVNRWYQPWTVYGAGSWSDNYASFATCNGSGVAFTITNSMAKDGVAGTYCLNSGSIVSL